MEQETKKKQSTWLSLKKGGLVWTIWNIVECILFLTLGILSLVIVGKGEGSEKTMQTMLNLIGIFLIIGGSLRILTNFLPIFASNRLEAEVKAAIKDSMSYDLIIRGSIELAGGIALVTMYSEGLLTNVVTFLSRFAGIFIGVILIIAAVDLMIAATGFITNKLYKLYVSILAIVLAAALLALGIVAIIYLQDPNTMTNMVLILLGVIFLAVGILLLAYTIQTIVAISKAKKVIDGAVRDATATSTSEKNADASNKEADVIDEKKEETKQIESKDGETKQIEEKKE